jgi:hypothetical protein
VDDWQPKTAEDPWPVIIVDEANELMSWQDAHPTDLKNLLSFFVSVSKQSGQCHVVLATSEYGFLDWLSQGRSRDRVVCRTACSVLLVGCVVLGVFWWCLFAGGWVDGARGQAPAVHL